MRTDDLTTFGSGRSGVEVDETFTDRVKGTLGRRLTYQQAQGAHV
jgi:hypothetical protein